MPDEKTTQGTDEARGTAGGETAPQPGEGDSKPAGVGPVDKKPEIEQQPT